MSSHIIHGVSRIQIIWAFGLAKTVDVCHVKWENWKSKQLWIKGITTAQILYMYFSGSFNSFMPQTLGFTMQICSKSEWGSTSTV